MRLTVAGVLREGALQSYDIGYTKLRAPGPDTWMLQFEDRATGSTLWPTITLP